MIVPKLQEILGDLQKLFSETDPNELSQKELALKISPFIRDLGAIQHQIAEMDEATGESVKECIDSLEGDFQAFKRLADEGPINSEFTNEDVKSLLDNFYLSLFKELKSMQERSSQIPIGNYVGYFLLIAIGTFIIEGSLSVLLR